MAAYLADLDISGFDAKAPPPQTRAFWEIVDSHRPPEDAELSDVLEKRHWPKAITLKEIIDHAEPSLAEWLRDRRNSRRIPRQMESVGYVRVRNETTKDGRWKIGGKNQVVYAKKELAPRARTAAVHELMSKYRG